MTPFGLKTEDDVETNKTTLTTLSVSPDDLKRFEAIWTKTNIFQHERFQ